MWSYNSYYDDPNNVLMHSSHKYIDKEYKNGRWYYTYDEKAGGVRRKESSASKTNVAYQKDLNSLGLNLKARNKVLNGTVRTGYRDTKKRVNFNGIIYDTGINPSKAGVSNREKAILKNKEKENKEKKQIMRDRIYSINNEQTQKQNAKAAEKEHSDKTREIDIKNRKAREKENLIKDYDNKYDRVYEAAVKLAALGQKNSNARQQDISEAGKYMEKYWKEWKKAYDNLPLEEREARKDEENELGLILWNLRNRMGLQKKEIFRVDEHGMVKIK